MMHKTKRNFMVTGGLFLLFVVFTVAVRNIDVRAIGADGSSVGFGAVNQFMFEVLGVNLLWYDITNGLGAAAIAVALGFGILGLCQLVKRKSILKVDYHITILGCFYGITAAFYVLFELVIINYRPIILDGELEASYPSSHTMLVICIMVTAMMQFRFLFCKRKVLIGVLDGICALLVAVTVVGRLISGVHWFTDIVAGILLSAALIMLYYSVVKWVEKMK